MAETSKSQPKTAPTDADVDAFVEAVGDPKRRAEARLLADAMAAETGQPAVLWGPTIIGYGQRQLRYASGRTLDWFRVGFSPRKAQSVLYVGGSPDDYADLLARLGKHSTGKGCLYLKDVAAADPDALRELVRRSYDWKQTEEL